MVPVAHAHAGTRVASVRLKEHVFVYGLLPGTIVVNLSAIDGQALARFRPLLSKIGIATPLANCPVRYRGTAFGRLLTVLITMCPEVQRHSHAQQEA